MENDTSENDTPEPAQDEVTATVTPPAYVQQYDPAAVAGSKYDTMTIWGFVLSLIGIFVFPLVVGVVAVILSAVGYSRISKSGFALRGKGLAIAGIIIGVFDIFWGFVYVFLVIPRFVGG